MVGKQITLAVTAIHRMKWDHSSLGWNCWVPCRPNANLRACAYRLNLQSNSKLLLATQQVDKRCVMR